MSALLTVMEAPLGKTERNLYETKGPSINLMINYNKSGNPTTNLQAHAINQGDHQSSTL